MVGRRPIQALYYALPCLILLIGFIYYPLLANVVYSLHSFSAFSPTQRFVGLDNYRTLLHDPVILRSLLNNTLYAVVSMVFQVGLGLVIAAILEDRLLRRSSVFFRTLFFLPAVISMTVIALLFTFFYNPQYGLLNQFLDLLGLSGLKHAWLGDSKTAMGSVIAVSQWQSVGYIMMLFIVAIQNIPRELYEAAEIDGATRLQRFLFVTLPQVKEMLFVTTVLTLTGAFTVFSEPYILTGGGPGHSSSVLGTYMYQTGFFKDQMGYASAIATLIFAITLLISVLQVKVFRTGKDA
ncbi:raffinose/stachyose/melibiose transport system permease protein [Deinobacterium chartae]|uniref:Raffinose/stachyose/melibiose transport system permease protein n=1 Tax=Deinobacterium chartae TaxID=521158 RepID=A0A841I1R0_9DEIO|nr:sugar ABC transporter permease [Deinobacterium chartae]MBB6098360.1 raffinose/stachyose/melibiose transport system permease protein [Deinobacterium chartae]